MIDDTRLPDGPVLVSGLPRSGTSMMMKMISNGGLSVLSDGVRVADVDNPEGYFEYEAIKTVGEQPSCLDGANQKLLKVISRLLYDLPLDRRYRVVFMHRDIEEILASQLKMLIRRGLNKDNYDQGLCAAFEKHLSDTDNWLRQNHKHFEVLYVRFADVHADPFYQSDRVNNFLGGKLDVAAMAAAVNSDLYRQRFNNESIMKTGH